MKTNEILENIRKNGGFCNVNNWTRKEIAEWVFANFSCSKYVAKNVSYNL
jgi:hypothetical protein